MDIAIRKARVEDVERIVRLSNAGGPDGNAREEIADNLPRHYYDAFEKINHEAASDLMVAEVNGTVVGTFHVVYIRYLAGKGREDAQVEAVHVDKEIRNQGIGTAMMLWVIDEARKRNCRRVQLTTNKKRSDAHRFYERLGFVSSHEGMKLIL